MKEERKAKIIFNKSGSGSITNRIILPVPWIKKLGITIEDITILQEEKEEDCIDSSIKKHHFKLPNGYTITSIYNNLNHLNISEYEQID